MSDELVKRLLLPNEIRSPASAEINPPIYRIR